MKPVREMPRSRYVLAKSPAEIDGAAGVRVPRQIGEPALRVAQDHPELIHLPGQALSIVKRPRSLDRRCRQIRR